MKKRINMVFDEEITNMAQELMQFLGCASISETFRYLVRRDYQKMKENDKKQEKII